MTLIEAIQLIEECKIAANLFGKEPDAKYRELSKLIHPDKLTGHKLQKRAENAFIKLGQLYGEVVPRPTAKNPVILGKWIVGDPIAKGDLANIYIACMANGGEPAAVKIVRDADDNDLLEQEAFALKFLHSAKDGRDLLRYIPRLMGTMVASDRAVNVLSLCEKQFPLHDLVALVPKLDFRHAVWMVNRTLNALGFAHANGIIHGAVLPPHLMFGPKNHSLSLIDWCYSVTAESSDHIPAYLHDWETLYPVEIKKKKQPSPATDIYMLMASMKRVFQEIPKEFNGLFDWCLAESQTARPQDAWRLLDRWLEAAQQKYGPPKFLELTVPAN